LSASVITVPPAAAVGDAGRAGVPGVPGVARGVPGVARGVPGVAGVARGVAGVAAGVAAVGVAADAAAGAALVAAALGGAVVLVAAGGLVAALPPHAARSPSNARPSKPRKYRASIVPPPLIPYTSTIPSGHPAWGANGPHRYAEAGCVPYFAARPPQPILYPAVRPLWRAIFASDADSKAREG
jgi:hypothetical protein